MRMRQYTMVKARAAEYGFDYYGGFTAGARHLHHIFAAIFDRDDAHQAEQAGDLLRVLMSDARAAGYGEYRAHLAYMDFAAAQYSFNDGALLRLSETIKDALDPAGILVAGQAGRLAGGVARPAGLYVRQLGNWPLGNGAA